MSDERSGPDAATPGGEDPADSASSLCAYDLTDPDHLEAIWLSFQRDRVAFCPETKTSFDLALEHHPAADDHDTPEVLLACGRCGRTVAFAPPDAKEIFGWAE